MDIDATGLSGDPDPLDSADRASPSDFVGVLLSNLRPLTTVSFYRMKTY